MIDRGAIAIKERGEAREEGAAGEEEGWGVSASARRLFPSAALI